MVTIRNSTSIPAATGTAMRNQMSAVVTLIDPVAKADTAPGWLFAAGPQPSLRPILWLFDQAMELMPRPLRCRCACAWYAVDTTSPSGLDIRSRLASVPRAATAAA